MFDEQKLNGYSDKELRNFIVSAKQATFAGGGQKQLTNELGGKEFVFSINKFIYRDRYYGSAFDIGQEIIWFNNLPIWGMNYVGGIFPNYKALKKNVFDFLKRSLLLVTPDLPFRGPQEYLETEYNYIMEYYGDLHYFHGNETIKYNGLIVYERKFIGGDIIY